MKISGFNTSRRYFFNTLRDDALLFISLVMILGAGVYYFYALNWPGIILTLTLSVVVFGRSRRHFRENDANNIAADEFAPFANRRKIYKTSLLIGAYALSYLAALAILIAGRSDRALITPWAVVSPAFFWLFGLSSLLLALILINKKFRAGLKIALLSAHYLISFAVAAVVYKIGYGYDPFIHEAAMELIAAKGLVLPKPPYYLGEYSLLIIIHKISGLTISFLDKILVPGLAAVFLPPAFYRFLKTDGRIAGRLAANGATATGTIGLTILFLLGLTFSPFILTTPQNLSYLFLILTVLAGFNSAHSLPVWILALATAAVHPLTGLPALAFAAAISLQNYQNRLTARTRHLIKTGIFLFASLALPLTLFFAAGDGNRFGGNGNFLSSLTSWLTVIGTAGREDWLSNFVYFFANNYVLIIIPAIAIALWSYYVRRRNAATENEKFETAAKNIVMIILPALIIAYLLSGQIKFNSLINYEQADYAGRLPVIMLIFLLPFLIAAGRNLIVKIRRAEPAVQIIWLVFGLGLLNAALYISYPRFDKYWNSRGYSTSQNDLAAVESVAAAAGTPYIALANQQVSAAALKEFGFDHYYAAASGPLYFYPIPTGGPLYQYYLDLVYKAPDQKTMAAAMALADVKLGYLIVNKYWYRSDRIIAAAKLAAEKWWAINNEVYIFQYSR
jgi:hypothetical protein